MLKISISKLEQARKNPNAFALSLSESSKGFGNRGSFSGTFRSYIGKFHSDEKGRDKLQNQLRDTYKLQFVENIINSKRAEKYCEAFSSYIEYMLKHGFGLDNFFTRIDLKILSDVALGGNSPILCSNETRNMVFSIEETNNNWQSELKYPILQKYLAEKYYKCESNEVEIGVFNINNGQFELKTYDNFETDEALSETKAVLGKVKIALENI